MVVNGLSDHSTDRQLTDYRASKKYIEWLATTGKDKSRAEGAALLKSSIEERSAEKY